MVLGSSSRSSRVILLHVDAGKFFCGTNSKWKTVRRKWEEEEDDEGVAAAREEG